MHRRIVTILFVKLIKVACAPNCVQALCFGSILPLPALREAVFYGLAPQAVGVDYRGAGKNTSAYKISRMALCL